MGAFARVAAVEAGRSIGAWRLEALAVVLARPVMRPDGGTSAVGVWIEVPRERNSRWTVPIDVGRAPGLLTIMLDSKAAPFWPVYCPRILPVSVSMYQCPVAVQVGTDPG